VSNEQTQPVIMVLKVEKQWQELVVEVLNIHLIWENIRKHLKTRLFHKSLNHNQTQRHLL